MFKDLHRNQVCGMDLSLTRTGLAFPVKNTQHVRTYSLTSKLKGFYKQAEMAEKIAGKADSFGVKLAVIEGFSMHSKGSKVFDIGAFAGAVKYTLFQNGVSLVIVPPMVLKKFALGVANDFSKEAIVDALRARYQIEVSNHDEADACFLFQIGCELAGKRVRPNSTAGSLLKSCTVWTAER